MKKDAAFEFKQMCQSVLSRPFTDLDGTKGHSLCKNSTNGYH